jgi:sensor domain CHASE-containing protein
LKASQEHDQAQRFQKPSKRALPPMRHASTEHAHGLDLRQDPRWRNSMERALSNGD